MKSSYVWRVEVFFVIADVLCLYLYYFAALGEQESRADQGWTYSNSYNCNTNSNNSNVYNSSPSSIDHWSSPAQHYSLSSASTPTVDNQIQEIKSSDTEE